MSGTRSKIFFLIIILFFAAQIPLVKAEDEQSDAEESEEIFVPAPTIRDLSPTPTPADTYTAEPAETTIENPGLIGTPQLAWYISRASGIAAFILLTIVAINGLLMSTRLVATFLPPPMNYEMHRFFSWSALTLVVAHFVSLLFDPYFQLRLGEALIPFLISRDYASALGFDFRWAVALGILAFYGITVLILTSEFRKQMSFKTWRTIHYVSFPAYFFFLAHGIMSGTDSKEWWMIWLYGFSALLVTLLVLVRVFYTIKARLSKARLQS
ncbi:MAG: hypothetical protein A2808_03915 [Candidatus Moranbacteria bacterium RIFCSPHIGHO2_01_FULL_55_24]|nr:MAG: hypothetical protein A2808_03915 [Candidatus Moranbacteria bacterium RIFCSPHIGHO2_01_FULL_55_24]